MAIGLIVGASALIFLAASPSRADACSCVPVDRGSLKRADAAIVGRLVEVRVLGDDPGPGEPIPESRPAVFTYRVKQIYKGKKRIDRPAIDVRTNTSSASCGLPKRRRLGLLLDRRRGRWESSLCTATSPTELSQLADRAPRKSSLCER